MVATTGYSAVGEWATLSAFRLGDGRPAWQAILPESAIVSPDPVPGEGVLVQPDSPSSGCAPVPV